MPCCRNGSIGPVRLRQCELAQIEADTACPLGDNGAAMGISRLLEVLLVALRLGLTSFGGPVAHRLLSRRVCGAPAVALGGAICGAGRALPVPAGARQQPARHRHRDRQSRIPWRLPRVAGIHPAVRGRVGCLRLRRPRVRWRRRWLARRPQDRGRGRGRLRPVGNGQDADARPNAHHHCRRCRRGAPPDRRSVGAAHGHRRWRRAGPRPSAARR